MPVLIFWGSQTTVLQTGGLTSQSEPTEMYCLLAVETRSEIKASAGLMVVDGREGECGPSPHFWWFAGDPGGSGLGEPLSRRHLRLQMGFSLLVSVSMSTVPLSVRTQACCLRAHTSDLMLTQSSPKTCFKSHFHTHRRWGLQHLLGARFSP